jgi:hypothetical protein
VGSTASQAARPADRRRTARRAGSACRTADRSAQTAGRARGCRSTDSRARGCRPTDSRARGCRPTDSSTDGRTSKTTSSTDAAADSAPARRTARPGSSAARSARYCTATSESTTCIHGSSRGDSRARPLTTTGTSRLGATTRPAAAARSGGEQVRFLLVLSLVGRGRGRCSLFFVFVELVGAVPETFGLVFVQRPTAILVLIVFIERAAGAGAEGTQIFGLVVEVVDIISRHPASPLPVVAGVQLRQRHVKTKSRCTRHAPSVNYTQRRAKCARFRASLYEFYGRSARYDSGPHTAS